MVIEPPFSEDIQLKASGQAALMLLEALIIDLIETGVLSPDRAIDSIQTVVETKQQLVADEKEDEVGRCAIGKLLVIENSLRSISYQSSSPLQRLKADG